MVELLGEELYLQFIIVVSCSAEVLLSNLLFNLRGVYRKKWWLSTLIAAVFFFFLSVPFAWLRLLLSEQRILQGICHTLFLLGQNILLLFLTYDMHKFEFLQTLCATHATRIFAAKSLGALLNLSGRDTSKTMFFFSTGIQFLDWFFYFLFHILIYIGFGFLFKEKENISLSRKGKTSIACLTLASLLGTDFIGCFMSPYENESLMLSGLDKLLLCFFSLIILLIRKGIFYTSRKDNEVEMMTNLLDKERERFEKSRENIDIINAKCHDLRHQLSALEGKITKEELKSLKEATDFYDSAIKTGNDVLDAVLYEYQLSAQNHQVQMTCMMDGSLLSFMEKSELYSLMSNALSNAIRALCELPLEKRILSLTLERQKGITVLEIDNYFDGEIRFDGTGLPLSTKKDGSNHGFGSKSIRYIVMKHHGNVSYKAKGNIFRLIITF